MPALAPCSDAEEDYDDAGAAGPSSHMTTGLLPPADSLRAPPTALPLEAGPALPSCNDPEGRRELLPHDRYVKQPGGWTLCHHPDANEADLDRLRSLVAHFDTGGADGLFARSLDDLTGYRGGCDPVEINLSHDRSIYECPRKHTPAEYAIMDAKCEQLRQAGIIVRAPPEAKYAMNSTMPAKRALDGTMTDTRFCQDARRLNEATIPDSHQLPLPEDLFQLMANAKVWAKADARAAFNQLPLREEDQPKTAFWWRRELWMYTRLLYGLRNATSNFQRVLDTHLRDWGLADRVVAFVDDLAAWAETVPELIDVLCGLFRMLSSIGIKLHPEKTVLLADGIEFLGHYVSPRGLQPTAAKIAAFLALQPATCLLECQRLLGSFGYYRGFIDHYSVKMAPITALTAKAVEWGPGTWASEQQQALDAIKHEFAEGDLVLRPLDPLRELILHTDWCEVGISGVLGQLDDDALEYMVACVSRTCNVHERRYGSYKGELLAAVWAIQTLRPYLHGRRFTLVTDHGPLEWLMTQRDLTGQAARWALILQQYVFSVVHRPGKLNQNADALSRCPQPTEVDAAGARLDHADEPAPPPPPVVSYPGRRLPAYARPPAIATTLATVAEAPVPSADGWLPQLAAQLAHSTGTVWPATTVTGARASAISLATLHAARAVTPGACVIDSAELLAGHNGTTSDAMEAAPVTDAAVRTAMALVNRHGTSLRQLRLAPRLRLRLCAARGLVVGLDTSLQQHSFFDAAHSTGVAVLEAPGGLAAGLQACVRLGIKVCRFVSMESRPAVLTAVGHAVRALAAANPLCLQLASQHVSPTAQPATLGRLPLRGSGQWLVFGSWGTEGGWSDADALSFVGGFQLALRKQVCPPPAYLLQGPVTTRVEQEQLGFPFGVPAAMDAVQAGVAAHRLVALYTNLAAAEHLSAVLDRLPTEPDRALAQLLEPGRQPMVAARVEPIPHRPVHIPGQRLVALPSATDAPPLRTVPGGEPCHLSVSEWEAVLGHRPGVADTLPPDLAIPALRDPISPRTAASALGACLALQRCYLTPHDTHAPPPLRVAPAPPPLGGVTPAEEDDQATVIVRGLLQRQPAPELAFTFSTLAATAAEAQEQAVVQATAGDDGVGWSDVWEDAEVMAALRAGTGTAEAGGAGAGGAPPSRRVLRRMAGYRWVSGQLLRCMADGLTRVCPPPDQRLALAQAVHQRTGHLGVRRTLALLQAGHWWYGMKATVRRVLQACRACDMSNARGEALPSRLNPLPVRGLFYRLGVDLAGPLPPSTPDGNRYVMVVIEHFSKHVELLPLRDKTSARTARALADVFARFGAPAEVLTDNGTEFEGEFADLLERSYVDHRHTTPGHPQADGAAERVVQVLKEALRKACYLAADAGAWEQALPELLLGYRCSPQASTRFSPYQLLYGGISPVIPPAVRERLTEPLDLSDPAAAADSLVARAAWVRQAYPAAAGNLLIAQHRDTLRYAAIRTGRYLAKPITYAPGDYVYVRRVDADQRPTLQFAQHDTILRVESVGPLGVAVLIGRDGARVRRRVEHLRPCHLEIDPAINPQLFRPQRDLQCEVCGSPHQPAKMVLCDGCNTGWHTHCVRLPGVPRGQWLCPRCKELDAEDEKARAGWAAGEADTGAADSTAPPAAAGGAGAAAPRPRAPGSTTGRGRRGTAPAVAESEDLGRLLFPRARTRRLDEQAAELGGRRVSKTAAGPDGVLEYLGALARPRYFRVVWGDGEEQQLTLTEARRLLAK